MNYVATVRTNYFHVIDETAWKELFSGLAATELEANLEEIPDKYGKERIGFAADDSVRWYRPASMCEDIIALYDAGGTLFDGKGNSIPREQLYQFDQLYDTDGELVYDRWDQDDEFMVFVNKLGEIIPEDEVFILMEAGHEGWRYVSGYVIVANRKGIREMSLDTFADKAAQELLGEDAEYSKCCY